MKTPIAESGKSLPTWFWPAIRIAVVIAMIVSAFILGSRCSTCGDDMGYTTKYGKMDGKKGVQEMRHSMDSMTSHDPMDMTMRDMSAMLVGKSGDELNRAFLEGMIPHHQAAVDMAAFLAASDKPELVKLG
jgi:Domain of unknown function (DUF305)